MWRHHKFTQVMVFYSLDFFELVYVLFGGLLRIQFRNALAASSMISLEYFSTCSLSWAHCSSVHTTEFFCQTIVNPIIFHLPSLLSLLGILGFWDLTRLRCAWLTLCMYIILSSEREIENLLVYGINVIGRVGSSCAPFTKADYVTHYFNQPKWTNKMFHQ